MASSGAERQLGCMRNKGLESGKRCRNAIIKCEKNGALKGKNTSKRSMVDWATKNSTGRGKVGVRRSFCSCRPPLEKRIANLNNFWRWTMGNQKKE